MIPAKTRPITSRLNDGDIDEHKATTANKGRSFVGISARPIWDPVTIRACDRPVRSEHTTARVLTQIPAPLRKQGHTDSDDNDNDECEGMAVTMAGVRWWQAPPVRLECANE